jgi:hypothetical protein
VGTSEGWVPHGCKVDGFMNTVMPQYNSQPPTRNTLVRNRIAHYQRPGQNPQRSHRPPPRPPTLPMAAPKGVDNHAPPTRRHRPRDRGFVHRLTGLADPDPHMSNPLAGLFSRGGLPLERGERARSSRVWCRRDFVDRSIQNYCPDKAPISHENSAFRLHHHHG